LVKLRRPSVAGNVICDDLGIDDDPDTATLLESQRQREHEEAGLAEAAAGRASGDTEPVEERAHTRRADKAAYLRAKLEERARSEDGGG
jgi:hypothetical protein